MAEGDTPGRGHRTCDSTLEDVKGADIVRRMDVLGCVSAARYQTRGGCGERASGRGCLQLTVRAEKRLPCTQLQQASTQASTNTDQDSSIVQIGPHSVSGSFKNRLYAVPNRTY
eukprot:1923744-Pyramimonas_sp.AAC.1